MFYDRVLSPHFLKQYHFLHKSETAVFRQAFFSVSSLHIPICQYTGKCFPGSGSMITSKARSKHDRSVDEQNQGTVSQTRGTEAEAIPLYRR